MSEDNNDDDLEVASVLASGLRGQVKSSSASGGDTPVASKGRSHTTTPARASTVLTNLSRGNTSTVTPCHIEDQTIHSFASEGEISQLKLGITDANLNEADIHGMTPLMWAAFYNQTEVAKYLLGRKALTEFKSNASGATALILASSRGHSAIAKMLLEHGADVDVICESGNTALLYASHGDHPLCVKILLEWGANLAAANSNGLTALEVAIKCGHRQVQALIEDHILHQFSAG